ncbi:beta-ketoacyl synthase N-terminal-like domain-containing protein [Micromonospora sp. NPDC049204]|uniref:beta-ketoacyl-[acyl-carrier-protein] synthase family protein n=1 Tax=unclassified Micromonospora TaxID=2617518 RepID=UPI0033D83ED2
MKRVVVTGVGLVTGLGVGTAQTWHALLDGKSAVGALRGFDASSLQSRLGAEVIDFDPAPFAVNRRVLRNMTRNDQFGVAGAALALADAGVTIDDPDRTGLFLGGNKEISEPAKVLDAVLLARNPDGTADLARMGTEGAARFYPLFYVEGLQAAALFYISQAHGLRGTNTYFAGTGEAGATAIGRAYRAVLRGEAAVAVAGGFDDPTSWWSMTKLDPMGVLTTRNDLGAGAIRPYDRNRDGFVPGEGAAFLVLEDAESAANRGASVYAEIAGFGRGFDPEGAAGVVGAIESALAEAGIEPDALSLVVTEGAASPSGDIAEIAALRSVLGDALPRLSATAVTAATGYLVAGAGALNIAVAALATRHGVVPPLLNMTDPDPACAGPNWVVDVAREQSVGYALALTRGFAGQHVALVLRTYTGRTPQ